MDIQNILQNIIDWALTHGIKIVLIFFTAVLINRFGKKFIDRTVRRVVNHDDPESEKKREDTLVKIFAGILRIIVWLVTIMIILDELSINIGPVLAGAGILGVAVGFGAQYMIRDFLAGLFIIWENQYRVGDIICLDGTCGLVEDVNIRRTLLRDLDGTVHSVPNGEIKKTSNLSKGYARVNLDVGVAHDTNLEKVIKIINKVGEDLANDSKFGEMIKKPPQFLRVNNFTDSAIIIKILGETKPSKQWDVTGELRKRLKIAFDKEGIRFPLPQMEILSKNKLGKQR
ncbi:mechanosensitive ion channel family protein [Patescibacteria group bacterium]